MLGCPLTSQAKVVVIDRISCSDQQARRLGWSAFGVATLDRGEDQGELWHVVDWAQAPKWGVGNGFKFKQPVNLHAFQAVELEVRSDLEDGCSVYLGIESSRGRKLKITNANSIPLTTSWKKVQFPTDSFKDLDPDMPQPFEDADWESVEQIRVFFTKPGGTTREKIMFKNVILCP